ncbi:urea amidolyase family protein [Cellulosimicrobium marinum]|uniref:5-oxoprolinase subunit B/C family protein n=1 Tax=Cellulosimicrobium marinum TaxID=1638992 RepID=UPI001E581113|nr:urea amidolyase family protein [Cellulosimicrobium marinum]MCB7137988.1 urea amidolyase family protein [Cellulosimicrobium marinum]
MTSPPSDRPRAAVHPAAVHPYGEAAFLVDLPDLPAVHALHRALADHRPAGVLDVVPAARTVLVRFTGPDRARAVHDWRLAAADRAATSATDPAGVATTLEIPTTYDGADLADVAAWAGVTVEEVVARHTARTYDAAFGGFAPGFTYLTGVDPVIAAPRLDSPRTSVPAGSVALAGELTAVYPAASPGGWRLLGRTAARMFDVDRDPPALVAPGTRVRFVPVRATAEGAQASAGRAPVGAAARPEDRGRGASRDGRTLTVLAPGPLTLVEDAGRPGYGAVGVGASGAADRGAAGLANRLVGNAPGAALLEVTLGGLSVRCDREAVVALAGAVVPARVDGTPVGAHTALTLPAGAVLRLGTPAQGLRTYVAVRGGIDVPLVLGSRAHDVLSGLGPRPLAAGDVVRVGHDVAGWPVDGPVGVRSEGGALRPGERSVQLAVLPGPHDGLFDAGAWRALGALRSVRAESNRVALRLDGQAVPRGSADVPSEGLVRGAVQVPPDGRPVVFLADRPATGGYPVIGVLTRDSADRAAQLRPGDTVRLRPVRPRCGPGHGGPA